MKWQFTCIKRPGSYGGRLSVMMRRDPHPVYKRSCQSNKSHIPERKAHSRMLHKILASENWADAGLKQETHKTTLHRPVSRIVGLVRYEKWPMCSRAGYKCHILHTYSLGYKRILSHTSPPPPFFSTGILFFSCTNLAAIKNLCSSPTCHTLKMYEYMRVYHTHSRVNTKCHF